MKTSHSTEKRLNDALLRLKHKRPRVVKKQRKLSIAAVAEEAGVSDSAIHNRYPQIAEEVRRLNNQEYKQQKSAQTTKLKIATETISRLNADLNNLKKDLRKLASQNASLVAENAQLKSRLESPNVVSLNNQTLPIRPK